MYPSETPTLRVLDIMNVIYKGNWALSSVVSNSPNHPWSLFGRGDRISQRQAFQKVLRQTPATIIQIQWAKIVKVTVFIRKRSTASKPKLHSRNLISAIFALIDFSQMPLSYARVQRNRHRSHGSIPSLESFSLGFPRGSLIFQRSRIFGSEFLSIRVRANGHS